VKAKMIMVHGFSDHVGRYEAFLSSLAAAGIAVYGFDQRGWGRSVKKPAERGLTGPTSVVIADIAAFIKSHLPSEVPVFVLGHSMGGGQVLTLASTPEYNDLVGQIRGWILEAPFIGFTPEEEPGWLTVTSGRLAGRVMPHYHLTRVIAADKLTRDKEVQQSIRDDKLMHDIGTLEGLAGMLDRTSALSSGKARLSPRVKSLILIHGDGDRVCSYQKAKEWYDRQRIEDGEFRTYEGFYHQLHTDPGKERFFEDVAAWILARSGEAGDEGKAGEVAAADGGPESKL
jgi:acylglycerol lipase